MAAAIASLSALAGCTALGGNVRGRFSCSAPDGICAPSSVIDDRALAQMSAEPAEASPVRAEGHDSRAQDLRAPARLIVRPAPGAPARTQEKVLRIVFQPYIDERGRLHEASAVHAVVARGEWDDAALGRAVSPAVRTEEAGRAPALASIAGAIGGPASGVPAQSVTPPDPAVVAAARARAPIGSAGGTAIPRKFRPLAWLRHERDRAAGPAANPATNPAITSTGDPGRPLSADKPPAAAEDAGIPVADRSAAGVLPRTRVKAANFPAGVSEDR